MSARSLQTIYTEDTSSCRTYFCSVAILQRGRTRRTPSAVSIRATTVHCTDHSAQVHRTPYTVHSTQYTAYSTQHTACITYLVQYKIQNIARIQYVVHSVQVKDRRTPSTSNASRDNKLTENDIRYEVRGNTKQKRKSTAQQAASRYPWFEEHENAESNKNSCATCNESAAGPGNFFEHRPCS